jgi:hypothetical protein
VRRKELVGRELTVIYTRTELETLKDEEYDQRDVVSFKKEDLIGARIIDMNYRSSFPGTTFLIELEDGRKIELAAKQHCGGYATIEEYSRS